MSILFFKHYWKSVGVDFCEAVAFETGMIHRGIIATNVVLIPKVPNHNRMSQFRPISLCNVVYKVISKIIVNRIRLILPRLICPTQTAFVLSQNIQDNNVLVQEIIHSFKLERGKEDFFAIKIDLVKVYDKLSCQFIDHVLQSFKALTKICDWVLQYFSTTSFNICPNGGTAGKITLECGIGQGDPLSPYHFIWAAEILSHILEQALNKGTIKGIKLSRLEPRLSHLFFVDDLILVGRATLDKAKGLWQCLKKFCAWSSQRINKLKNFHLLQWQY
uniref:Reverse transcriptase domain-containing protein n=1 Tax=Cannabis sativa TaxID=3483 RepID=A0A803Q6F0_CANSA